MSWRAALGFADRLRAVSQIAAALPECSTNAAEARKKAQHTERAILEDATDLEDYWASCEAASRRAEGQGAENEAASDDSESDAGQEPVHAIGLYTGAKHHRDGLFSSVFRATAPEGGAVALKVTTPSQMTEPHDSHREARILKALKGNNVIPLLDFFQQAGGRFVLVFPFLPHDLQSLADSGRITDSQARSHICDMFAALAYIHGHGIIHRDVKPSNVLLNSPDGPAYLADFGIAWAPADPAAEPPAAKITDVGTSCYRPPELLFGNTAYGPALDLWAAGCVVAEVASRPARPLFEAGDAGSELALIHSMFKSLGTPTLASWPEAATLRDWGKMSFKHYDARPWAELLPAASAEARDFVGRLVRYESGARLRAAEVSLEPARLMQALEHPYLRVA